MNTKDDDFVPVQATVRRSKVSAFFRIVSELNAGPEEVSKEQESLKEDIPKPWGLVDRDEEDVARRDAVVIYEKISPKAREIVNYALDHNARLSKEREFAGEQERFPIHGHDLAKALDLNLARLAGTMTSIALRSKAIDWEIPIGSRPNRDHGGHYWLKPEADGFFREARAEYELKQKERERYDIMRDLDLHRLVLEHEYVDPIDDELRSLDAEDPSPEDRERRSKLLEERERCRAELVECAEHRKRMERDPTYLPPENWRLLTREKGAEN